MALTSDAHELPWVREWTQPGPGRLNWSGSRVSERPRPRERPGVFVARCSPGAVWLPALTDWHRPSFRVLCRLLSDLCGDAPEFVELRAGLELHLGGQVLHLGRPVGYR
ncbi:MAG TPA: hypothetical protein PL137_12290, partial [Nocardioides sp.]|nr:hypothetical protein [Nocardioides sp.]